MILDWLLRGLVLNCICCFHCRPGGELEPGEDEVEGLKRLLTEVSCITYLADVLTSLTMFFFFADVGKTRRNCARVDSRGHYR